MDIDIEQVEIHDLFKDPYFSSFPISDNSTFQISNSEDYVNEVKEIQ